MHLHSVPKCGGQKYPNLIKHSAKFLKIVLQRSSDAQKLLQCHCGIVIQARLGLFKNHKIYHKLLQEKKFFFSSAYKNVKPKRDNRINRKAKRTKKRKNKKTRESRNRKTKRTKKCKKNSKRKTKENRNRRTRNRKRKNS